MTHRSNAAQRYQVEAPARDNRRSTQVALIDADNAESALRAAATLHEAFRGHRAKYLVATRLTGRREDKCQTCGREVTARESGYCDLRTARVWCSKHKPVFS